MQKRNWKEFWSHSNVLFSAGGMILGIVISALAGKLATGTLQLILVFFGATASLMSTEQLGKLLVSFLEATDPKKK